MSDGPRPGWPGAPEPEPPAVPTPSWSPPAEAAAAEPPSAPSPPSWERVTAAARRTVDLKLVIAVLIGLVSVTGAVLAWNSAISGEHATDKDRQAIAETVTVEQARADNEIIVQDARARFAEHAIAVVNAGLLEQQAARLADQGDDAASGAARREAVELRAVARRVLEGTLGPVLLSDYVQPADDGGRPTFEEERLTSDLEAIALAQNQLNPVQTIRQADRLRAQSEEFDRWLIFMVAAVVVLTLAQIVAKRPLRIGLTVAGTSVWIVSSVLAFWGS